MSSRTIPTARYLLTGLAISLSSSLTAQSVTPLAELQRAPSVTLSNGLIAARVYLPDQARGYYRGTRFDWAGMIDSLTYAGHDFYPPWFDAVSSEVRDFVHENGQYIASPQTAASGPAEEFNGEGGALGYADAAPGGTFIKIGVGVLQRLDDGNYNRFQSFPIVDPGERINRVSGDRIEFLHRVQDTGSGYGYEYTKTLQLEPGQPVLVMAHELRNTGSRRIDTTVYNHNFLNIDDQGTLPGLQLSTTYPIQAPELPDPALATLDGNRIHYLATPPVGGRVSANLAGFGNRAEDYDFHIANAQLGAGLRITGDRPMSRAVLWSVAPVMSVEPFIAMSIAPGQSFSWTYRYTFQSAAGQQTSQ